MQIRSAGVVAGIASLAFAAPVFAAAPANVTVRVEGAAKTLQPETKVLTTTTPVSKDGSHSCPGTSAIGALDVGVSGDWDGPYSFSQSVETIRGETHVFDSNASANQYWTFWLNYAYQNLGACDTEVQEGDAVLWFPSCFGDCSYPDVLKLEMPASAKPGEAVDARVTQYHVVFDENFNGTTTSGPAKAATVSAGAHDFTTDDAGVAHVVLDARGPATAVAAKTGTVRSATREVCVSDGADGFCGTTAPGAPAPAAPAGAPCETAGDDGLCGTRDRRPPQGSFVGIVEKQAFAAGAGPRELRGTVSADPSSLSAVKLRLTRRHRGRCWYFSGKRAALVPSRCGRSFAFKIGDRADWSYLLPARLPAGRYVLDVVAIDGAFNRDPLARGRNRVVFTVG